MPSLRLGLQMRSFFVALTFGLLAMAPVAAQTGPSLSECEELVGSERVVNHEFYTRRGLTYSSEAFGARLFEAINSVPARGLIINGGAGEAVFEQELLSGVTLSSSLTESYYFGDPDRTLEALAILRARPKEEWPDFVAITFKQEQEGVPTFVGKLRVLKDRFFEAIPDSEVLGSHTGAKLIIDLWGIAAYSKVDYVLRRYLELLDQDGVILFALALRDTEQFGPLTLVTLPGGERVDLIEWLGRIPGLNIEFHSYSEGPHRRVFAAIRKKPGVEAEIPVLEQTWTQDNGTPHPGGASLTGYSGPTLRAYRQENGASATEADRRWQHAHVTKQMELDRISAAQADAERRRFSQGRFPRAAKLRVKDPTSSYEGGFGQRTDLDMKPGYALSPDGNLLATPRGSHFLQVRSTRDGALVREFERDGAGDAWLQFSNDSQSLLVGLPRDGIERLDLQTGARHQIAPTPQRRTTAIFESLDGSRLWANLERSVFDRQFQGWRLDTGESVSGAPGSNTQGERIPGTNRLLRRVDEGWPPPQGAILELEIVELDSGTAQRLRLEGVPADRRIRQLSASGRFISLDDGSIWELPGQSASVRAILRYSGKLTNEAPLSFGGQSAGRELMAVLESTRSVGRRRLRILDPVTGRSQRMPAFEIPERVRVIALSPDSQFLALGLENGKVQLWDWRRGQLVETLDDGSGAVRTLEFSPDGSSLLVDSQGSVSIWRMQPN